MGHFSGALLILCFIAVRSAFAIQCYECDNCPKGAGGKSGCVTCGIFNYEVDGKIQTYRRCATLSCVVTEAMTYAKVTTANIPNRVYRKDSSCCDNNFCNVAPSSIPQMATLSISVGIVMLTMIFQWFRRLLIKFYPQKLQVYFSVIFNWFNCFKLSSYSLFYWHYACATFLLYGASWQLL